jgi:predicted fused transcriptional regulator/phosphomethylpyrimidine kinase
MLGETGDKWLNRLHMQLSRELRSQGWSQMDIATMLGTTQSTVSRQYQKPIIELPGSADALTVDGWAKEIASGLISIGPEEPLLRQRFVIEFQFGNNQVLRYDKTFTGMDLEANQKEQAMIRRLEWAISRLDSKLILPVLPQVGLNIASCMESATSTDDVASIPGKITAVGNVLRTHSRPEFGSSKTLAGILLDVRKMDSSKNSIIGWTLADGDRDGIEQMNGTIDAILDIGDFGWEPSLYVLASNPLEVVDRCHNLIHALEGLN